MPQKIKIAVMDGKKEVQYQTFKIKDTVDLDKLLDKLAEFIFEENNMDE